MKKVILTVSLVIIGVGVLGFIALQLVPYGHNHTNPAVVAEPKWDNPKTRELAKRACFDCHSNETVWPWYSNIAPVSWLIQKDVDEGRTIFNFSEWNTMPMDANEIIEVVSEGRMPPSQYLPMHPNALFSPEEKQIFFDGLGRSLGSSQ